MLLRSPVEVMNMHSLFFYCIFYLFLFLFIFINCTFSCKNKSSVSASKNRRTNRKIIDHTIFLNTFCFSISMEEWYRAVLFLFVDLTHHFNPPLYIVDACNIVIYFWNDYLLYFVKTCRLWNKSILCTRHPLINLYWIESECFSDHQ